MRLQSRQQFCPISHTLVLNSHNGEFVGHLVDISESGLKMLHYSPFVKDEYLQLLLKIHKDDTVQFAVDATCRWSGRSDDDSYFMGGFYLPQPSIEFVSMVGELNRQRVGVSPADSALAFMSA